MDTAIDIRDLTIELGHQKILKKISLNIPKGRIVGLIGPSGAGKTTLMRAIVGRQRIDNGEVLVEGLPAGSKVLRKKIGYMSQDLSVYPDLSVQQNFEFFAKITRTPKKTVHDIIEHVGLTRQMHQLAYELSGGQKSRLSLGITLLGQPTILVLDEPTVGQDPQLRQELWKYFHRLRDQGITLFISSHVMEEAERCDELVLLRRGRVLITGSPAHIKHETRTHSIEASFLRLVGGLVS